MSELAYLDQVRVVLSLAMLGIATVSDIKKREISDIIWIVFGALGVGIILLGTDSVIAFACGLGCSLHPDCAV